MLLGVVKPIPDLYCVHVGVSGPVNRWDVTVAQLKLASSWAQTWGGGHFVGAFSNCDPPTLWQTVTPCAFGLALALACCSSDKTPAPPARASAPILG